MRVLGVLVDDKNKTTHYILHYPAGKIIERAAEVKRKVLKDARFYNFKNLEVLDGELNLTKPVFRYRVEGWDALNALLKYFEKGSPLSKRLANIDEDKVDLIFNDVGISINKGYRGDTYFSEYDYDSNGYNDAQFDGWEIIPHIVSKETGIPEDDISTGGGEKLWFGVTVDCRSIVKLKKIK